MFRFSMTLATAFLATVNLALAQSGGPPPLSEKLSPNKFCIHAGLVYSQGAPLCVGTKGYECVPLKDGDTGVWSVKNADISGISGEVPTCQK
jgi:hypothetical protein